MKLKSMLSAVLVAGVISAQAESASSTAAMATPAAGSTNSTGADAMTTLFGDPVIVKAKGFEVKRSELDSVASGVRSGYLSAGREVPQYLDALVLNHIVIVQMMLQKATDDELAKGKAEADEQLSNVLANASSADAFQRDLKLQGITEDQMRARIAQDATAEAVLKRVLNVAIDAGAVRDFYSNNEAKFEEPERVHCEHILLMTIDPSSGMPLASNTVASKHEQAEDLLKRVKGGEDFATLAKQYSEDPSSKLNGGELPPFPRGEMVPEFEAAAFSLSPGQISDIVTSKYGFHIIKLLDKTPAKKYGFDDPIPEAENKTPAQICHDQLEAEKMAKQLPAYVDKLRTEMDVQIVDQDLKTQTDQMMQAATNAPPDAGNGN